MATGAEVLVEALAGKGVTKLFSVVGNQLNDILMAAHSAGIEVVACRHEGTACLAAEAYARTSGGLAVCLVIPGPGVSNALTGLLEAQTNCAPVLLLTVRQPSRRPRRDYSTVFHGLDQVAACTPFTRYAGSVRSAHELGIALQHAFSVLEAPRPQPAFLELDLAVMQGQAEPYMALPPRAAVPVDLSALERAADLLVGARRCVVVAGRAVHTGNASPHLRALAEALGAPVVTTTFGKGVIPDDHPLHIGTLYEPEVRELMAGADLVLSVGVRFTQFDTADWTLAIGAPLVQLDPESEQVNSEYEATVGVVGDLAVSLAGLLDHVGRRARGQEWPPALLAELAARRDAKVPTMVRELSRFADERTIFAVDVHEAGYPAIEYLDVRRPEAFLCSGVSYTLGYGIPAAIGAKLARPDARVIAYCGDGGLVTSSQELATVAKYAFDITFVVIDDGGYGTIRHKQLEQYGVCVGADLANPDFGDLASAFGMEHWVVEDLADVGQVLDKAVALDEAVVIEIDKQLLVAPSGSASEKGPK